MTATEWAGPPAFLPPPPATTREDGVRHVSGASYACPPGYRRCSSTSGCRPGTVPRRWWSGSTAAPG